ncbi:hypothetical protein [Endozoicomonas sp. SESOKO2]|nr:hypothetical protein [Endozoicomonas sp. SESOKO2]
MIIPINQHFNQHHPGKAVTSDRMLATPPVSVGCFSKSTVWL